jgi:putative nucleotidyltransferase with HDIG domain
VTLDAATVLARVAELPALPAVVGEIIGALDDDRESAAHIVDRIGADPVLVARVLAAANAAGSGAGQRIGSTREAITLLGFDRVRRIVLATALVDRLRPPDGGFDPSTYWRHSIAVALCAQALARELEADPELAFNVGLLHDIGQLFIVFLYPQEFAQIRELARQRDSDIVDAERAVLGVDHGMIGSVMAEYWQLPPAFAEAIAGHHDPDGKGNEVFGDIVHVAEVLAYALDLGTVRGSVVPALAARATTHLGLSWHALAARFPEIEARYRVACRDFGF